IVACWYDPRVRASSPDLPLGSLRGCWQMARSSLPPQNQTELPGEAITDAVLYLVYAEDARLPEWFDPALRNTENFRSILGFEQVWADYDPGMPFNYSTTFLTLPEGVIPIEGYQWAISLQNQFDYGVAPIPVTFGWSERSVHHPLVGQEQQ
ncbi:MAG: hypothetical protein LRY35_03225, partial [Clostridiales bacterium]|nr:hypothetical protein [Clostridiales bacterium]